jgi:hypothetical protein
MRVEAVCSLLGKNHTWTIGEYSLYWVQVFEPNKNHDAYLVCHTRCTTCGSPVGVEFNDDYPYFDQLQLDAIDVFRINETIEGIFHAER